MESHEPHHKPHHEAAAAPVPPSGAPVPPPQPQPQGYGYPPQYAYPAPQPTNGLAIAGFICSFIIPLVGLILSIIGLSEAKKKNGAGHGLALAGTIISSVFIVLFILYFIFIFVLIGVTESNRNQYDYDDYPSSSQYDDSNSDLLLQ